MSVIDALMSKNESKQLVSISQNDLLVEQFDWNSSCTNNINRIPWDQ